MAPYSVLSLRHCKRRAHLFGTLNSPKIGTLLNTECTNAGTLIDTSEKRILMEDTEMLTASVRPCWYPNREHVIKVGSRGVAGGNGTLFAANKLLISSQLERLRNLQRTVSAAHWTLNCNIQLLDVVEGHVVRS